MVGSYPRPLWFTHQLAGRDVLEAFKIASHAEAFHDATRVVIKDQEEAGLDILTDGQMWFDDYNMGIGSFLWYWLERTKGFSAEKLPHPARDKAKGRDIWALDNKSFGLRENGGKTAAILHDNGYKVYGWDVEWEHSGKTAAPKKSPQAMLAIIDTLFANGSMLTKNHLVFLGHEEMLGSEKARNDLSKQEA